MLLKNRGGTRPKYNKIKAMVAGVPEAFGLRFPSGTHKRGEGQEADVICRNPTVSVNVVGIHIAIVLGSMGLQSSHRSPHDI